MFIWAALIMGFIGSFHCVGMCGPIALALPGSSGTFSFFTERLLYNMGRIVTYALLGGLVGLAGGVISMAGWQGPFSMALGVAVILFTVVPRTWKTEIQNRSFIQPVLSKLRLWIPLLIKHHSMPALFVTGVLNGFLPCGFVYMGLAGAASLQVPSHAVLFMMAFGAGTLPAMLFISFSPRLFNQNIRSKIRQWLPYLAVLVGMMLIFRGLNLGIPLLSPALAP